MKRARVGIVGAGKVGATTAQWLLAKGIADVVLVDVVDGLPQGVALDALEAVPDSESLTGFGLLSVRERLAVIGGQLEIRSQPEKGTRVTMVAPVFGDRGAKGGSSV